MFHDFTFFLLKVDPSGICLDVSGMDLALLYVVITTHLPSFVYLVIHLSLTDLNTIIIIY